MTGSEKEHLNLLENKIIHTLLWGTSKVLTPEEEYRNYLKFAWVNKDGERLMVYLHNKDFKAYEIDKNYSLGKEMKEVLYTSFERWCTTFDL